MEINRQATLYARKSVFIQASPHHVWRIQTDIDSWGQWHPGIASAKLDGVLAVGTRFIWKSGGMTITSTIQKVEPERRIGWTGDALGSRASHLWIFTPQDGGTLLTTEEAMDGWLVGIFKLVMPTFLDNSIDTWLQALKKKVESQPG